MRKPSRRAGMLSVIIVVIVVTGCGSETDFGWRVKATRLGTEDHRSAAVDALVAPYDLVDGPGGVLGVYLGGEILYARGFGLANLEYQIANTPSTVFRVGSVSKQFAAMAIAILAQRGDIALDEDIRKYFPEIPPFPEGVVTLRHLVHHTSGLRDYNVLAYLSGYRLDQLATTSATFELLARQRSLNNAPGNRFVYSNSGYFLMAVLVERLTGKTMAEFARSEIFEPLGMSNSLFKDDHGAVVPERAYGYVLDNSNGWRLYLSQRDFVGAGGVFTTAEDMLHWFVYLNDGDPELMEQMSERGTLNDGKELEYAFGLIFDEDRGLPRIHHSGGFAAFTAHTVRYPEQRLAVFTAVNGGSANAVRLALEIADAYLRPIVPELAQLELPTNDGAALADPVADVRLVEGDLDGYIGTYDGIEVNAIYEVMRTDEGIALEIPGRDPVQLQAIGDDVFKSSGLMVRLMVTFERAAGRINGLTLDSDRAKGLVFERLE